MGGELGGIETPQLKKYQHCHEAKGPAKEEVWIRFKQSLEQQRTLIIESNTRMEESERKRLIEERKGSESCRFESRTSIAPIANGAATGFG
jgi:hypothetical protein